MLDIQYNIPASRITWFGSGGLIKELITIHSIEELRYFMQEYANKHFEILGLGSNTLISDQGLNCLVRLKLKNIFYDQTSIQNILNISKHIHFSNINLIYAQAGLLTTQFIRYCIQHEIGGLEFMQTIPGTIGGLIRMNAGAYGKEIKDVISVIEIMNPNGEIYYLTAEEMNFTYRKSVLPHNHIITGGLFGFTNQSSKDIETSLSEMQTKRMNTQPLKNKSLGSVFKNPKNVILTDNQKAILDKSCITFKPIVTPSDSDMHAYNLNAYDLFSGQLIESCNLKGTKIGGAMISNIHANFIENINNATSTDYLALVKLAQQTVYDKYHIHLELENKILSENSI